jgi:hypothetical protein
MEIILENKFKYKFYNWSILYLLCFNKRISSFNAEIMVTEYNIYKHYNL